MAIRTYKKISELNAVSSASLSTYVAGVDNGETVRITLGVLATGVRDTINTLDIQRLAALETYTSSVSTGSLVSSINNLNQFTASQSTGSLVSSITNLNNATSSYETKGRGILSGSVSYTSLTNIPAGIVSQSTDITSLNSFTSSQTTLNTAFTNGINARLQTTDYNTFSASVHTEIVAATNEQSLTHLVTTSSFNSYTASISTGSLVNRLNAIENTTGSYLTSLSGALSSSSQLTSSLDNRYILESETSSFELTGRGIISASSQLAAYYETIASSTHILVSGSSQLTQSYDARYTLSGSVQPLPSSLISSSAQITSLGFATTGSNTFTGLQTLQSVQETISLKPSLGLGTNNFDFNNGSIFYIAGLTGSGTWNVQNIQSASNSATSLTFVVEQGATAYTASAYQLGGTSVSVKWLDGAIPTGSANSTDVISITAFRSGSSYNVIGSLSKFS